MLTLWNGIDRALAHRMRRMDRLFTDNDLNRPTFRVASWPRVNVSETEEALEVTAEVPGFTAEDVNVTLHEGELVLEGDLAASNDEKSEEDRRLVYRERRALKFRRSFRINVDVDYDAISALVKDGLLTVTLPKAAAAKPKQIQVKAE